MHPVQLSINEDLLEIHFTGQDLERLLLNVLKHETVDLSLHFYTILYCGYKIKGLLEDDWFEKRKQNLNKVMSLDDYQMLINRFPPVLIRNQQEADLALRVLRGLEKIGACKEARDAYCSLFQVLLKAWEDSKTAPANPVQQTDLSKEDAMFADVPF